MGWVGLAVMAVGALVKGGADSQAAQAESELYKQNEALANANAQDALFMGEEEARQIGEYSNQLIGTQRAAAGSSGLSVNEGSALDVQESTAFQSSLDISRARYNARRKAWAYQTQAQSYKYQSKLKKKESKGALLGGLLNAAGNIYGGAG